MIASISWPQSVLNFFRNKFWFVKVVPKYLNSSTFSKVLLSILTLWFRPAFWSRDLTMYLVLSALNSSPFSLGAATKASAFSFRVCILPPSILTYILTSLFSILMFFLSTIYQYIQDLFEITHNQEKTHWIAHLIITDTTSVFPNLTTLTTVFKKQCLWCNMIKIF